MLLIHKNQNYLPDKKKFIKQNSKLIVTSKYILEKYEQLSCDEQFSLMYRLQNSHFIFRNLHKGL
jgi:hypothetical protein